MLLGIIYIYNTKGTTDLGLLMAGEKIEINIQRILFLAFMASFAVKIPK
jgi:NADH:ubiquinone oxidoreductase subunit 4 (subunit M)